LGDGTSDESEGKGVLKKREGSCVDVRMAKKERTNDSQLDSER